MSGLAASKGSLKPEIPGVPMPHGKREKENRVFWPTAKAEVLAGLYPSAPKMKAGSAS